MTRRRNKPCVGGVHNWGDVSACYDIFLLADARGLTTQALTVICDSCGASMKFLRVEPADVGEQDSKR